MAHINYHNRCFVGVVGYEAGDFTRETVFKYHQEDDVVWATYRGGGVLFGTLIAVTDERGRLEMSWQYVSVDRQLKTGTCLSTPEILADGRLRLHERWRTTSGPLAEGESVVEELPPT